MTNYPTGAANDARAPFNETSIKPVKVDVIVYKCATQINGCVNNFVVNEIDAEPGYPWGAGATLEKALESFEESYMLRHDEPCEAVIKETKIQY